MLFKSVLKILYTIYWIVKCKKKHFFLPTQFKTRSNGYGKPQKPINKHQGGQELHIFWID